MRIRQQGNSLHYQGLRGKEQMAKQQKFEPEHTQTLTFRLRPASIFLLRRLSAKHGGVGRAIQVAAEILRERGSTGNKRLKTTLERHKDVDSKPQELFSFPALPRTVGILNHLSLRYYDGIRNLTVRACIQMLYELDIAEEILPGIPKDENPNDR
jgi:hypothetical protein